MPAMRTCAYHDCDITFPPKSVNHRFCCSVHKDRQRRYEARQASDAYYTSAVTPEGFTGPSVQTVDPARVDGWECTFIVNDTQYPYVDGPLWDAVCTVAEWTQPDRLIAAGDMHDFDQLSTFTVNPHEVPTLGASVEKFKQDVEAPLLSVLPEHCEKVWLDGNHEARIFRYVTEHAPAIADLIDPKQLMRLDAWDYYYPYSQNVGHMLAPDLLVTHGNIARSHSAYTAKAMVEQAGISVLHGHTHRRGSYFRTDLRGTVMGVEMGAMCDERVCPGFHKNGVPNWQQVAGHAVYVNRENPLLWDVKVFGVVGRRGDRRVLAHGEELRVD